MASKATATSMRPDRRDMLLVLGCTTSEFAQIVASADVDVAAIQAVGSLHDLGSFERWWTCHNPRCEGQRDEDDSVELWVERVVARSAKAQWNACGMGVMEPGTYCVGATGVRERSGWTTPGANGKGPHDDADESRGGGTVGHGSTSPHTGGSSAPPASSSAGGSRRHAVGGSPQGAGQGETEAEEGSGTPASIRESDDSDLEMEPDYQPVVYEHAGPGH